MNHILKVCSIIVFGKILKNIYFPLAAFQTHWKLKSVENRIFESYSKVPMNTAFCCNMYLSHILIQSNGNLEEKEKIIKFKSEDSVL